jgi:hypothetical protein
MDNVKTRRQHLIFWGSFLGLVVLNLWYQDTIRDAWI